MHQRGSRASASTRSLQINLRTDDTARSRGGVHIEEKKDLKKKKQHTRAFASAKAQAKRKIPGAHLALFAAGCAFFSTFFRPFTLQSDARGNRAAFKTIMPQPPALRVA